MRKRLNIEPELRVRKRLKGPIPDRVAPIQLWIGQKQSFKAEQLAELNNPIIERMMGSSWIVVFSGPGYKDVEHAVTKESAKFNERFFMNRYPEVKSTWLQTAVPTKSKQRKFDRAK